MTCEKWKERLIGRLYGESDRESERRLADHLATCESCRSDLEGLSELRHLLAEAAPDVPAAPRVLMLEPPRRAFSVAFATGFACATALLATGLLAGWYLGSGNGPEAGSVPVARVVERAPGTGAEPAAAIPTPAVDDILRRLDLQDERIETILASRPSDPAVTRGELKDGLSRLRKDVEWARAADMRVLFEEIAGVEVRTGTRLGEAEQALRHVVLASDPRVSVQ